MKTTMIIPSYWTFPTKNKNKIEKVIYDHPTPLNHDGTLLRMLKSTEILENKNFNIVVLACPTSDKINNEVENKVKNIIKEANLSIETLFFGPKELEIIQKNIDSKFYNILSIYGYSNIRNLCIFIPHLLNSKIAILIDDDEVFTDKNFINKALEFIGTTYKNTNEKILGKAGYYINSDGEYKLNIKFSPFMAKWKKADTMNKAFDLFIASPPRIKPTPFAFGGNMIIHKELFTKIPFDPQVTRGEDIDYLINSKFFGFNFFLDNELNITHIPPAKPHSEWKKIREDFIRFIREYLKIKQQKNTPCFVNADDFAPYPGEYLKDNLFEKISDTSQLLCLEYLSKKEFENAKEALKNISISKNILDTEKQIFQNFINFKIIWEELMTFFENKKIRNKIIHQIF